MTDLGEIFNNSKIILDLLTKSELGDAIWADDAPLAVVTYTDGLGAIVVANVKLNEMNNVGEYAYELDIPADWAEGQYMINYSAYVNGIELLLEETFILKHIVEVEEVIPVYKEVKFGDRDVYILPPELQIECELVITETGVTIKPKQALKYNHTYTLVLSKDIENLSKDKTFENTERITFTSQYSPLYATPLEVRAIIRNFFQYFNIDEIYTALRDAGEKAHVYKDLVPDANNSRFKLAQERETYYFALTKYQAFEASRVLLTKLLMYMLQGNATPTEGSFGSKRERDLGFTLGDLTVSGDSGGDSIPDANTLSAQRKLLEDMIREIEKDLKFWQDSMMGHHRRSYAKPTSASFRSGSGSPESREF